MVALSQPHSTSFALLQSYHQLWTLHWLIKITWCSDHKIPFTNKKVKFSYKKIAQIYKAVKAVVEDICTREAGYSSEYNHQPAKWLVEIIRESRLEGYTAYHAQTYRTKTNELNHLSKERAGLKKYHNSIEKDLFPHTWRFIESGLDSSQTPGLDVFRSEKWNPFIQSWRFAIKEMRESYWINLTYDKSENLIFAPTKTRKNSITAERYLRNYVNF